ncbi:MAG: tetratricopeptide repeat protein [Clostridiales bacterium]|nr:tetratricopeptide repeat protein [Clostridiales bacterium]
MKKGKTVKIDFSRERLASRADKYYNEGKFLSALRLAYRELELYGGDGEVYARFSDIYEGMDLHASAINFWFRFLDEANAEDLPDIYEGLAVNYLHMGNETQAAYYYNKLIDADDSLPEETKMDIVEAFAKDKREKFRFVYPPKLADFSKEVEEGSEALKAGNCKRAIELFALVEKGSKNYAEAREMQAVAHLLDGDTDAAKRACEELLQDAPNDVRVLATLAAIYLEEGNAEESKRLALQLCELPQKNTDELYKVATVCCENGLHRQAYEKFCEMENKVPFDGRMLYFKAVAAYKCGMFDEAERAFDTLCTVYPDAEVAKYYLRNLRAYQSALETNENAEQPPEPSYFYHLPQEEREARCRTLIHIGKCAKDEAQLFGLVAWHDGYFQWCFDEMDGTDHDLQYLALATAAHVGADDFLREVLLDCEVLDILKIETLRMLLERNEDMDIGIVLCHIYRRLHLQKISVGRKKRKRVIEAYAQVASKFVVVSDAHGKKIKEATEKLYKDLEKAEALDLIDRVEDCACAIFVQSGIKELRGDIETLAKAFDANVDKVRVLLATAMGVSYTRKEEKEEGYEAD